ncbi:MAG: Ldh family oxidoreductase, partial [Pseudomonadota bacterium]
MDERLTLDEAEALAQRVLRANGCDGANARAVAANMVRAERDGALSHGLFRLPGHVALLRAGVVNGRAVPSLTHTTPSALIADADLGFAPRTYPLALPALIEAARAQGMAALGIRRC